MCWWTRARSAPKDIELFQFADTPEQAFEMLRTRVDAELPGGREAKGFGTAADATAPVEDLMAGPAIEFFQGPDLAKTSK